MVDTIPNYWSQQMGRSAELFRSGDLDGTEATLNQILSQSSPGSLSGLQLAETLSRLVLVLTKKGLINEARIKVHQAMGILQQEKVQNNPLFLTLLLQNLNILKILPDKNTYLLTLEETLNIFQHVLGPEHTNTQSLQKELDLIRSQAPAQTSDITKVVQQSLPQQNLQQQNLQQQSFQQQSLQQQNLQQQNLQQQSFQQKNLPQQNLQQQSSQQQNLQQQNFQQKNISQQNVQVNNSDIGPCIINPPQGLDSYILKREKVYHAICLTIGIICYLVLACLFNIFLLLILPMMILFSWILNGLFCGHLKGSSVRISANQLPKINKMIEDICSKLNMPVPDVYVSNGEGMLNAFATRLLSRDFVILYSNILEMAFEKGEDEVAFVIAHELAHIKRGHTKRQFMYIPAKIIPFLEHAYSRSRESTCDRIAAAICPRGAKWGLVALATGAKIYRQVDLPALYQQFKEEHGFWTWFAEILSTHPTLVRRITMCGLVCDEEGTTRESVSDLPGPQRTLAPRSTGSLLPSFIK